MFVSILFCMGNFEIVTFEHRACAGNCLQQLWLKNFETINLHSSAPLNEEGLMNRKLPEELILRIFSYLDIVSLCRCAQVCRTWNILALDGSNWQNVDLFQFQKDIKTGSKKTLSQTKNSSKVVNFNFVTVKQIVVSANCTLGRDMVENEVRRLIVNCQLPIKRRQLISEQPIRKIRSNFIAGEKYESSLSSSSGWEKLNLLDIYKSEIENRCAASVVENLAKRCGGFLKKLSLRGCESVQDGALDTFARKCNFIEELNLEKCKRLSDSTCESLGLHCKRLRVLNLDCISGITERGLKFISDGCPNLEWLNISWCNHISDEGLEAVAKGSKRMKALICKGCTGLTDEGLRHVGEHCHDLRVLNLQSCSHITDQGISYIANGCHRLDYLCLSMCSRITDRALQSLSLGCQLLKDLEVSGCSLLTDSGFHALAKNCHDLERMDLEDCSLITDQTASHLATGCRNLIELVRKESGRQSKMSLSHCELITDEGIRSLAQGLSAQEKLNVLELDNCPLITDQALESLQECRTLKRIELYDCQQVTRSGIRRFKQNLPTVMVHAYFAPATPPVHQRRNQHRYCRCCKSIRVELQPSH
ncbi:F-box/LRR-repeat protein 2 [Trichinella spiralis]|uniref:F-box/LRR-repeat protein 2 n=1 Tax=Trichinella spiralis TaxID=6334 RepID=UPI0001EFBCD9|nr:F-box/LRR-repeat protein 2 [Trichinella spiralis]